MNPHIDSEIVTIMLEEKIDFICSVPCNMLAGVLNRLHNLPIAHIPVTREEEGVGIAAGAALGGKKPALLMQNSGLGNSLNALLSLTKLYGLPLSLIISQRGGKGEKVSAQMPMGKATPNLLKAARIDYVRIKKREDLIKMRRMIRKTFDNHRVTAILLLSGLPQQRAFFSVGQAVPFLHAWFYGNGELNRTGISSFTEEKGLCYRRRRFTSHEPGFPCDCCPPSPS
jgi:sulfopyruvate decarboxylase subunit alpha